MLWQSFDLGRSAVEVLGQLIDEIPWRQEDITLWGKTHKQPRLISWYGDPGASYTYSGTRLEAQPWTSLLAEIRKKVEQAAGFEFNSVLLNYYRDGRDSMGFHSDDEPELGPNPVIASLSLGETRRFVMKHRHDKSVPDLRLDLPGGSLLLMRGETQSHWKHGITRTARACGPRVNLTFRRVRA